MLGADHHPVTFPSPTAVRLRVANVREAADFYQQRLGFRFVMAVPDEHGEWLLCLLRYGSGSILLGALEHSPCPQTGLPQAPAAAARGLGVRIDLIVTDLVATYAACAAAGCRVTAEPAQEIWGDRTFSCLDPFGYEWQFTERAERMTFDRHARATEAVWS